MKRLLKWLLALAVVAGVALGVAAWVRPEPPEVAVHTVRRADIADTVPGVAAGYIEPLKRVRVQPELGGRVVEVAVRRGQRVHAGDLLARLDDADLRDQVWTIQAALPVLEARVRQAGTRAGQVDAEAERARRLFEGGSLPGQQLDNARYGVALAGLDREAAVAALRQARVNLDVARASLRKTEVRAPIDGVVLDVAVEVGEQVSALSLGGGSSPAPAAGGRSGAAALLAGATATGGGGIAEIADDSRMYAVVDVDEADFHRVAMGQPAVATIDALGRQRVEGVVEEVYPYVSRALDQNRTARLKVRLPEDARTRVLPGMSANVEVTVARRQGVLVVPTEAVLTRPTGKVVMRLDGDRLAETAVRVGVATWEALSVESGLSEGDRVALPPGDIRLVDGMRVRPRSVE